jgi:Cu+-exporting ATPase
MITGEPIAVSKKGNDKLIGATINKNGTLVMQAERIGRDTMLAQIVDMVSHAQRSRAPIQKLADSVASYFVPAVVISALLAFIGWYIFGPEPRLAYAIVSAVAVLIIACPCALGLATPISIMVGTGRAALLGILIKDAETLEMMEKVTTLVVDKTGTLTEGKPRVTSLIKADGFDELELLKYAASLESVSEHPLSEAIIGHAINRDIALVEVKNFNSITGKGIVGKIDDKNIIIGSESFLNSLSIPTKEITEEADILRQEGKGVIFMAVDSRFSAIFGVEDPIKNSCSKAIQLLQEDGVHVVVLSGDNEITANHVAKKLGIDEVYANVMPEGKIEIIKKLQDDGAIVAMAGDGINDAPALAQAGIVRARKLSRATMKNIRQNLFFAFVYNSAGVPIAAGLLYPFFGLLLSPVIAAAAMSLSSVSVIANALRLKKNEI